MQHPLAGEYAGGFAAYVAEVPPGAEPLAFLAEEGERLQARLRQADVGWAARAYAPGKWTVKQVLGHLADAERIFAYRALRFARGDATPLPGFDENAYAHASAADLRTLDDLLDDLLEVRAASLRLLRALPPETHARAGTANGVRLSVRALACIIAGHERHHLRVIEERYGGR